ENAQAAEHARGEFLEQLRLHTDNAALLTTGELVFGELIGNVVRHAPGPVEIYLDWDAKNRAVIHVIDTGPPFESNRDLPPDILSESGRGLFIIRQVSSHLRVERIAGHGNHVSVELPIPRHRD